ncbi:Flavin reductase like domain protein [Pigmentiphaga humi]|uniref:Flavin reductase like domain protein n=1 Tax=Pigmentiphaga humi TaxID=2478468 RepID=A0A3P4AZI6_9BURK|nr:flavin reductase family protein [Pigmentiphaga humi]VCU68808.1 Flavin reductase like domain protein [Pigmentiphaga humi]
MPSPIDPASPDGFSPEPLNGLQRYKVLMGSIVPRPIALVSSLGEDGTVNAAPFSNYMALSTSAMLVGFSVGSEGREARHDKDTLRNIRANSEFVINTVSDAMAHQVQTCGKDFPPDVSEIDAAGFSTLPSAVIKTPRIAESKIHFECRLHSIVPFGDSNLVVGQVVWVHAAEGLLNDFKVDLAAYAPLGRLGGRVYCRIGELIKA